MSVMPDTSAWVRFLRYGSSGDAASLKDLLEQREVMICGPVMAELLAGTKPERQAQLAIMLDAIPWIEVGRHEWRRVGQIGALLRARGMTVALTDIEIAVAAEAASAEIWTFDSDFKRLLEVMPSLRLRHT
jgi:predicted nucleic acid-binding protein